MTQSEKRLYLLSELLKEQPRYTNVEIPTDTEAQKLLLRSLFNIRMPKPVSEEFLKVQDPFWQMTTENPNAVYASINAAEAYCPSNIERQSVLINGDIQKVLKDCLLSV